MENLAGYALEANIGGVSMLRGTDGITPTIGENGNWYLGDTDTGKPSRGAAGDPGTPGKDGADGHTPVKGMDYWTASDKAEVVAESAAAIDLTPYAKKTEVPTQTSQLTNDSGFLTSHQDISGKQDKATLEADVSAKGFTKNTFSGSYNDLTDKPTIPTALPNPNALTIKIGSTTVTYDGSAAKTVEIADGSEVSY